MRFGIGLKREGNKNESVVYLMLESTVEIENGNILAVPNRIANRFDLEEAKAYLNNLAAAIRPYAAHRQVKLQKKDLAKAEAKNRTLLSEGISLAKQNDDMRHRANTNENAEKSNGLERKKAHIEQSILINQQEQVKQTAEVEKQKAALTLLTKPAK